MRTVNDVQRIMLTIALWLKNVDRVTDLNKDGLEAIIREYAVAKVGGTY